MMHFLWLLSRNDNMVSLYYRVLGLVAVGSRRRPRVCVCCRRRRRRRLTKAFVSFMEAEDTEL